MKLEIKARLNWVQEYEKTGNAGLVCRRCGISRPTLRKWYKRYLESGLDGLQDKSKRPHRSPNIKVTDEHERIILNYRKKRKLGPRRIQNELIRNHNFPLSLATIHKVLKKHNVTSSHRTILDRLMQLSFRQNVIWLQGNHDNGYLPDKLSDPIQSNKGC